MIAQISKTDNNIPKTQFHIRLREITDAINSLADKSGDTNININISAYILLINLNIFLWWQLCRDRQNPIECILKKVSQDQSISLLIDKLDSKFKQKFEAILLLPKESDYLRADKKTLSKKEEDQQWRERVSLIQDLCLEIWQSSISQSPTDDLKSIRSDMTEVKTQLDQLLSHEEALESGLERDIAQLISGDFPQPTPEALTCIHQLSLIEDLICEESFNLQKTIESLEDYRNNLEPSLGLLAKDHELQQEYQNAFNPAGWSDSFEVRRQHFLELQLLRLKILQYFASIEGTGETSTQES